MSASRIAPIAYLGDMKERPRFHAQDHSRDNLLIAPRACAIADARAHTAPPSLRREGFELVAHRSAVKDFADAQEVARVYEPEIARLIKERTGADEIIITGKGVLRFSEKSPDCGRYFNSMPARFAHVDVSEPTARRFALSALADDQARLGGFQRFALYNIWRVASPPPQDVPLAVCDARSVAPEDLICADAVFDAPGAEWEFEGLVVRDNPNHRWSFFAGMSRDEALIFKTYDSDPDEPRCCPHVAFDDPLCPEGVAPRASIEMRAIGFFRT